MIVYLYTIAPWTISWNKILLQNDFYLFQESVLELLFYFFLSYSSENPLKAVELLMT